ncbi:MAG: response regulator [Chloroherpetonaceae bacterium]|nr:response regulator [Chloroherpetonaceae bacterium]
MLVIVDDDFSVREMLTEAFIDKYPINLFSNGLEALKYIKANKGLVQVVLTDYAMPEMNGADLSIKVKEFDSDIFIIMMSGFIDFESIEHLLKRRVIHQFITKPFNLDRLMNMVETANRLFLKKTAI